MTRKEAIEILKNAAFLATTTSYQSIEEAVKMAVTALEQQEPCGDTISRQAAINAIRASTSKYTGFMEMEMYTDDDAVEAVEGLPPTQPEHRWIPCSVMNQCYIPELKDVDYKGILFTYKTAIGKRLVKINWIERGRIIGKQMNGIPIAYMMLPEPYREEGEK